MENENNCFDCDYSVVYDDGSIGCDRTFLEDGRIINVSKPELYCPVNSNINLIDSRYNGNAMMFDADDVCQRCHRIVVDNDWNFINLKYKNGDIKETLVCSICAEKFKEDENT